MRTTRIYHNGRIDTGDTLKLSASASNHLVRVLRCRKGSTVTIFNGEGGEYTGTLQNPDLKAALIAINGFTETSRESRLCITLIQGISRSEHMDTTVQKATELGVNEIIPALCARSLTVKKERALKKHERWQQIVISACEQSGRNSLPVLHEVTAFDAAINEIPATTRIVLDPYAQDSIIGITPDQSSICILSGPEGGLTEQEITAAAGAGFERVRFGPRILRTETAAPALIAALQTLWGDMG
ncbi:MAG: 16S rRNA (uracil(1498)-N(3))-methyltransferase [Thiotrichales bacterium]|nr:MAG: 16S rRNA (uracil(1498)-N(3))-methyltransferase [Thiotrichales bacterium]